MFHYILTTDFSKGSQKALDYAAYLATQSNSNLTLLWVDNTIKQDFEEVDNSIKDEGRKSLTTECNRIKILFPNLKIDKKIKSGKVYQEISSFVKTQTNPLLVLSSHGASGYKDLWIGSNANRIITNTNCPVLIVRRNIENTDIIISKILVPIDHTHDTLKKLNFIIPIAKIFNSEIKIVSIYSNLLNSLNIKVEQNLSIAKQNIDKTTLKATYDKIVSDNIANDLLKYITNCNCDLVVIMNEQNLLKDNNLIGELPMQIINQSVIPVLSIPSIENNNI